MHLAGILELQEISRRSSERFESDAAGFLQALKLILQELRGLKDAGKKVDAVIYMDRLDMYRVEAIDHQVSRSVLELESPREYQNIFLSLLESENSKLNGDGLSSQRC